MVHHCRRSSSVCILAAICAGAICAVADYSGAAPGAEIPARPRLAVDGWLVNADVECGNSRTIEQAGQNHFELAPREDPLPVELQKKGPISAYVVYVEVTNERDQARTLTVDILIPDWLIREKFDYFLRKTWLARESANLEYEELPADCHTRLPDRTRLTVNFAAGEKKILASIPAYPYSHVCEKLRQIERQSCGRARVCEIGTSIAGRPILSLEVGDGTKPRVVFLATLQPGEPSAWGVLAMIEAALFDPELAELCQNYDLAFVPMTNPDGVVEGSNNVNGAGVIVMLGFEPVAAGEQPAEFREAAVLWKYLEQKPPAVLIDFHFLTLPNHTRPRPYIFTPALYGAPEQRLAGATLVKRMARLNGAPIGKEIGEGHPLWKNLVTYNAIKQWGTAATLYQNTGPRTSWRQAQRRAVELLRVAVDPDFMNVSSQ